MSLHRPNPAVERDGQPAALVGTLRATRSGRPSLLRYASNWRKRAMELTDEESLRPFKSLMDAYDQSFYTRNIEALRSYIFLTIGWCSLITTRIAAPAPIRVMRPKSPISSRAEKSKTSFENGCASSSRVTWRVSRRCFGTPQNRVRACEQPTYWSARWGYGKFATCIIRSIPMRSRMPHNPALKRTLLSSRRLAPR